MCTTKHTMTDHRRIQSASATATMSSAPHQSCPLQKTMMRTVKRLVPAFTSAALQTNVLTGSPDSTGAFLPRRTHLQSTRFGRNFSRCEFPIQIEFVPAGIKLAWKVEIERLDFFYYLPLFFEGLMETQYPYDKLAEMAVHDMVTHGGLRVTPVVPHIALPVTQAMNSRNLSVMARTLRALQDTLKAHVTVGPALVPFYRQILPVMNMFKERNLNIGDHIEFSQRKRQNVADLINETLELMERTGGPNAFINIKYMVPTYESCLQN